MDDFPIDDEDLRDKEAMKEAGLEPHVGMDFSSRQAAYDFYNAYGYLLGFSIRMNSHYKNTKGVITSMRLVCSKQGFKGSQKIQMNDTREIGVASNERTPKKQVSDHRCGCKAACHVKLHEDGVWRITGLHKDHNHPFVKNTPSKKRHLRSHKNISMEDKADIELLNEQNIGATQIREYLADKAGGKMNLCYSKKDVSNQITSGKRNLIGVDVNAMVDYFMRRQQEDEVFFFEIEPDEDNAAI